MAKNMRATKGRFEIRAELPEGSREELGTQNVLHANNT